MNQVDDSVPWACRLEDKPDKPFMVWWPARPLKPVCIRTRIAREARWWRKWFRDTYGALNSSTRASALIRAYIAFCPYGYQPDTGWMDLENFIHNVRNDK